MRNWCPFVTFTRSVVNRFLIYCSQLESLVIIGFNIGLESRTSSQMLDFLYYYLFLFFLDSGDLKLGITVQVNRLDDRGGTWRKRRGRKKEKKKKKEKGGIVEWWWSSCLRLEVRSESLVCLCVCVQLCRHRGCNWTNRKQRSDDTRCSLQSWERRAQSPHRTQNRLVCILIEWWLWRLHSAGLQTHNNKTASARLCQCVFLILSSSSSSSVKGEKEKCGVRWSNGEPTDRMTARLCVEEEEDLISSFVPREMKENGPLVCAFWNDVVVVASGGTNENL